MKAKRAVFRSQVQEEWEWPGRGETREVRGHGHPGEGLKEEAGVCVGFCQKRQVSTGFATWRPSVIVARAVLEARGEVGMAVFPLVDYGHKFSSLSEFSLFQKGSLCNSL